MTKRRVLAVGGTLRLDYGSTTIVPRLGVLASCLASTRPPNVLHLGTASGDDGNDRADVDNDFEHVARDIQHLELFRRSLSSDSIHELIRWADVIYVSGGNTANAVAIWQLHKVDRMLREAWNNGTIAAGSSAGAMCWFTGGLSDSFGGLRLINQTLGMIPGLVCPHYDDQRRSAFRKAIRSTRSGDTVGYGIPNGSAILFEDDRPKVAFVSDGASTPSIISVGPLGHLCEAPLQRTVDVSTVIEQHKALQPA